MKKFVGKGVYGAVAAGKATVLMRYENAVKRISIEDTERERARVTAAIEDTKKKLQDIYERALGELGESGAQIFAVHSMLLEDTVYRDTIDSVIESQRVNAEYAVTAAGESLAESFAAMDDAYMRERAADVRDVSQRLTACLAGETDRESVTEEGGILCADDLSPSVIMNLDKKKTAALVMAQGSLISHAAILARSRSIPAVVGAGEGFLAQIMDGDEIMVDGFAGEVFLEPDAETRMALSEKQRAAEEERRLLQSLRGRENIS
ncbi:MAG: phosphoenolpyruvate--protein phosphotransferase, partial [Acetatifactor sp.]|nr:phosphoenolpyruvate--protein phosphotransferase [Acetatifactor sp.]